MAKETPDTKPREIKLPIQGDFSEAAIEDAAAVLDMDKHERSKILDLTVSIFDAKDATSMMLASWVRISTVTITRNYGQGEFRLEDRYNKTFVKGGIDG